MAKTSLPPGFRFHPTDVELIMYYLKRKLMGKRFRFEAISELNLYNFCPWELPGKSCLRSKDLQWFFFCPRERKYASGARRKRATERGFWKATGKDRPVNYKEKNVGMVKTLVFHNGHAPQGERTNWVMHEYRMIDADFADAVVQDAYVLCKVFEKSGAGPKNGAQYGAPFQEEEWEDDTDICALSTSIDGLSPATVGLNNNQNNTAVMNMIMPQRTNSLSLTEPGPSTNGPSANEALPDVPDDDDDIASLLGMFTEETPLPVGNDNNEELNNLNRNEVITAVPSEENDLYNGLGDMGNWVDLNEDEVNISGIHGADYALNPLLQGDDTSFLELCDLETPLGFTHEASTVSEQLPSDIFSAHYDYHGTNLDPLFHGGNFLDTVQHFSPSNQSPALLEGLWWRGNHINLLELENGSVDSASQDKR